MYRKSGSRDRRIVWIDIEKRRVYQSLTDDAWMELHEGEISARLNAKITRSDEQGHHTHTHASDYIVVLRLAEKQVFAMLN